MAEIPARVANPRRGDSGITTTTWTALTEADTAEEVLMNGSGPIACCLQVVGTFGGGTIVLQGSNDGTNWSTIPDVLGSADGLTSNGIMEFSTSVVFLRPFASVAGTSRDVDVILSLRG